MNLFIDTSSLIKLYHKENDTQTILDCLNKNKIELIFLSSLTKIEFVSAFWKKIRNKEIEKKDGIAAIELFKKDEMNYKWITIDEKIADYARHFIEKYGEDGLRTLDAIQLSTGKSLENKHCTNIVSDKLLTLIFEKEKLKILKTAK